MVIVVLAHFWAGLGHLLAIIRVVIAAAGAAELFFTIVVPVVPYQPTDQSFRHGAPNFLSWAFWKAGPNHYSSLLPKNPIALLLISGPTSSSSG